MIENEYFWIGLEAAIHVQALQFERGPTSDQIAEALRCMELLFHPAVSLRIRQEKSEQEAMNVLIWSLATLAYRSGGVRFGPLHIKADVPTMETIVTEVIAA